MASRVRSSVLLACLAVLASMVVGYLAWSCSTEPAAGVSAERGTREREPRTSRQNRQDHRTTDAHRTAGRPRGLTGDDLPDLPAELRHLADVDVEDALADPDVSRELLRRQLRQDTHADLLRALETEGHSPGEMAEWMSLIRTAREARDEAEAATGGR